MRFRYIGTNGTEHRVAGVPELVQLIRGGEIGARTMLFDGELGRWVAAEAHDVFQAARNDQAPDVRNPDQPTQAAAGAAPPGSLEKPSSRPQARTGQTDRPEAAANASADAEEGRQEPMWLFRKNGITVTIAGIGIISVLTAPVSGAHIPESMGSILGLFAGALLLPALVLLWSDRTRRYIPIIGLGLLVFAKVIPMAAQPGGCESLRNADDQAWCEVFVERYRSGEIGLAPLIDVSEDDELYEAAKAAVRTIERRFHR